MKQEFKYWIYAEKAGSKIVYRLSDIRWSGDYLDKYGRVFVGEYVVSHELPDVSQFLPGIVSGLEAKKLSMQATAAAAIAEIDGEIQSLMAIGHEVAA